MSDEKFKVAQRAMKRAIYIVWSFSDRQNSQRSQRTEVIDIARSISNLK